MGGRRQSSTQKIKEVKERYRYSIYQCHWPSFPISKSCTHLVGTYMQIQSTYYHHLDLSQLLLKVWSRAQLLFTPNEKGSGELCTSAVSPQNVQYQCMDDVTTSMRSVSIICFWELQSSLKQPIPSQYQQMKWLGLQTQQFYPRLWSSWLLLW